MRKGIIVLADVSGRDLQIGQCAPGSMPDAWEHVELSDQNSLYAALGARVDQIGDRLAGVGLAVSGFQLEDAVRLYDTGWTLDLVDLRRRFGTARVRLVTKYAACALAAPGVTPEEQIVLQSGKPVDDAPISVVCGGRSLGAAFAVPIVQGSWKATSTLITRQSIAHALPSLMSGPLGRLKGWGFHQLLSHDGLDALSGASVVAAASGSASVDMFQDERLRGDLTEALAEICAQVLQAHNPRGGLYLVGPLFERLQPILNETLLTRLGARTDPELGFADFPVIVVKKAIGLRGVATLFTANDQTFEAKDTFLLDC